MWAKIVDWIMRGIVGGFALGGLAGSAMLVVTPPVSIGVVSISAMLAFLSAYVLVACIRPAWAAAFSRMTTVTIGAPLRAVLRLQIFRPFKVATQFAGQILRKIGDYIERAINWTIELAGRLIVWGFWAALAIVAVGAMIAIVFVVADNAAKMPVSVAIIIGAIIIASAVANRR